MSASGRPPIPDLRAATTGSPFRSLHTDLRASQVVSESIRSRLVTTHTTSASSAGSVDLLLRDAATREIREELSGRPPPLYDVPRTESPSPAILTALRIANTASPFARASESDLSRRASYTNSPRFQYDVQGTSESCRSMTIKDARFVAGEILTQHQFHVLQGYIRDVVDDLKRMQSLQRSYNEMSEELTKKDRLLAENDALIEQLRAQESADIRQFKQDTTTQLRAQVAKVTALTAQLQALTAQNADLDSRLVASQLRERELQLENERLSSEGERLLKELQCFRASAGRLDLEMKDLTVTMDERLTTTVQLQERLEFVARDAEERLQRQALEAQDGAARLRALTDFLKAQLEAKEHRMRTLGLMLTNPSLQLEAAPEMPAESPGSFGASLGEELLRLSLLVPRVSEVHGIQNLIRQHALQSSQRLDGLAEQLRQVTATMDFQEADIALLTQRNAELEARLKGARAAHEEEGAAQRAATARLELALQAMTAERDQCSAAVREVTAKWESSRHALEDAQRQVADQGRQLTLLEEELRSKGDQLERERQAARAAQVRAADAEGQTDALRRERGDLQQRSLALTTSLDEQKFATQQQQRLAEQLRRELADAQARDRELALALEASAAERGTAEAQGQALAREVKALTAELQGRGELLEAERRATKAAVQRGAELEAQAEQLRRERADLQEQCTLLKRSVEELTVLSEERLLEQQRAADRLQQELASAHARGRDLSRAVEERAWEKAEAEAQGEARTREAQLLRAQCAELTGRLEALQRDRQRLEQDIQALTTDRQEETERWVAALEQQVDVLAPRVRDHGDALHDLEAQFPASPDRSGLDVPASPSPALRPPDGPLQPALQRLGRLAAEVGAWAAPLARLGAAAARARQAEEQGRQLQRRLDAAEDRHRLGAEEAGVLVGRVERLSHQLVEVRTEQETVTHELVVLRGDRDGLQQRWQEAVADRDRLAAQVAELERRLHDASASLRTAAEAAEGQRAELRRAQAEAEGQRAELQRAEAEAEEARRRLRETQAQRSEGQRHGAVLEDEVRRLTQEVERLQEQLQRLRQAAAEHEQLQAQWDDEREALSSQHAAALALLEQRTHALDAANEEKGRAARATQAAQDRLAEAQREAGRSGAELAALREQGERLQRELEAEERGGAEAVARLERMSEQLRAALKDLELEAVVLKEQVLGALGARDEGMLALLAELRPEGERSVERPVVPAEAKVVPCDHEALQVITDVFGALYGAVPRLNDLWCRNELRNRLMDRDLAHDAGRRRLQAAEQALQESAAQVRRLQALLEQQERQLAAAAEEAEELQNSVADFQPLVERLQQHTAPLVDRLAARQEAVAAALAHHGATLPKPRQRSASVDSLGSSPVADPVKELLRRESGRVASCREAVEDLQRLEEGLLEVLTRREADLEAVKAQNAVLEEELQRSQGALHDAAIKLDGLGRELHFAEDGQEHLRALERMVKEHLERFGRHNERLRAGVQQRDEEVWQLVQAASPPEPASPPAAAPAEPDPADPADPPPAPTSPTATGRISPVYPVIMSPGGQLHPPLITPAGSKEQLDVAFDIQLYHLEQAILQLENSSTLVALRSRLQDKERQVEFWEQKYADASDALRQQAELLAGLREAQELARVRQQTLQQQLSAAGSQAEAAQGKHQRLHQAMNAIDAALVRRWNAWADLIQSSTRLEPSSEALGALRRRYGVESPLASDPAPTVGMLVNRAEAFVPQIEAWEDYEQMVCDLLADRDATLADLRQQLQALRDLAGVKADEAARAGAQAELLRARIDQQAVEARLKESEVADRVRRLARLNGELEEALNRRNAAMNAMFSAWLPADQLPTDLRRPDPQSPSLPAELARLADDVLLVESALPHQGKVQQVLLEKDAALQQLQRDLADAQDKCEDLVALSSELKAAHWATGRWRDAVHDQLTQKKVQDFLRSWAAEEEYERERIQMQEREAWAMLLTTEASHRHTVLELQEAERGRRAEQDALRRKYEGLEEYERRQLQAAQEEEWRLLVNELLYGKEAVADFRQRLEEEMRNRHAAERGFLEKDEERARQLLLQEEADAYQAMGDQQREEFHQLVRRGSTAAFMGLEISEGILVDTDGNGQLDTLVTVAGFDYNGVKVLGVRGPALRAGVEVNDIVTHLNKQPTRSLAEFKAAAARLVPGQTVALAVIRAGKPLALTLQTSEVDRAAFTPGRGHSQRVTLHNFRLKPPPERSDSAQRGSVDPNSPVLPLRGSPARDGSAATTPVSARPTSTGRSRMGQSWGSADTGRGRLGASTRTAPPRCAELEKRRQDVGRLEGEYKYSDPQAERLARSSRGFDDSG